MPIAWDTACRNWQELIVKGGSLLPLPPLFPQEAVEALDVFDNLAMVDAPKVEDEQGDLRYSTFGELSRPWIRDFVGQIFGSYESQTGIRHITEYFMLISKKNGKSTNAAAIMLTALILNWRDSAEFIILSPTIEVAQNSFKPAADMVRADPELSDLLHVQDHIRTITHRTTGATLKVVAADSNTVSGKKAVGVLIDELWLFGKMAHAEDMIREATGGLTSRPEGFIIYLTTQSNEPPAGVYKQKLEYARNVRDGKIHDPQFLPLIFEFPKAMLDAKEHLKPENFYISNPNLGASVNVPHLQREFRKAQEEGEESLRGFLAKHLNVEIGLNLRSDRWPGADFWEQARYMARKTLPASDGSLLPVNIPIPVSLDTLLEKSEVITFGIDGGGLDDLLGAAAVGRCKDFETVTIPAHVNPETGLTVPEETREVQRWLSWTHAWAHPSVMERRQEIAPRLCDFAKLGQLTLVNRIGQDVDQLAENVWRIEESGLLYQVGLDPNAIGGVLDAILLKGVPEDKLVSVNQGYRLAGAIKTTERKLAEGVLVHGGTELMNWCVGNAKVKVVGNAIVITKQVSGTAKIDPLMALFNAVSLMALNPPSQCSDYNFDSMAMGG